MATAEAIAKTVVMLCEAFGRDSTPELLEAYEMSLAEISDAQLFAALKDALRTELFFPKPARLLQLCGIGGLAAGLDCIATIRNAVRRVGKYRTPIFEDAAIAAAIDSVGGWVHLCELYDEEFERFTTERLRKAYEAYTFSPPLIVPKLSGLLALDRYAEVPTFLISVSGDIRRTDLEDGVRLGASVETAPTGGPTIPPDLRGLSRIEDLIRNDVRLPQEK